MDLEGKLKMLRAMLQRGMSEEQARMYIDEIVSAAQATEKAADAQHIAYKSKGTTTVPQSNLRPFQQSAYDYCDLMDFVARNRSEALAEGEIAAAIAGVLQRYPTAEKALHDEAPVARYKMLGGAILGIRLKQAAGGPALPDSLAHALAQARMALDDETVRQILVQAAGQSQAADQGAAAQTKNGSGRVVNPNDPAKLAFERFGQQLQDFIPPR